MNSNRTAAQTREKLDGFRQGIELTPDGKERRRAAHLVNRDVWTTARAYFDERGKFFRAPAPYYIDNVEHRLIAMNGCSVPLATALAQLGLLATEPHTKLVAENLIRVATQAPVRPLHHLSYMSPEAIYLRASETKIFKVTPDSIAEVPLGTDNVISSPTT